MSNKSVLILGGNGYIGSRLYEHLISRGYTTDNVDLNWHGLVHSCSGIDYKYLSREHVQSYSHIVLLAGHSSVSMCVNNLYSCFKNNVVNYIALVDKLSDEQTLLYASSCAVYGSNPFLVDETTPIKEAKNNYDYTKICREQIAALYPKKKMVGLRFGSVGGFSKNFRNENLMNSLTKNSRDGEMTLSNGESYRAVLSMSDVVRAIERIIDVDVIKNKVYNLVSVNDKIINFGLTVKELSGAELILNNEMKTDYSFQCSNALFERDYDFKFTGTIESMYNEIIQNYSKIVINGKREVVKYE